MIAVINKNSYILQFLNNCLKLSLTSIFFVERTKLTSCVMYALYAMGHVQNSEMFITLYILYTHYNTSTSPIYVPPRVNVLTTDELYPVRN